MTDEHHAQSKETEEASEEEEEEEVTEKAPPPAKNLKAKNLKAAPAPAPAPTDGEERLVLLAMQQSIASAGKVLQPQPLMHYAQ